jgi:protein-S-isoprenylcysteine O-methyltransferase Ste14
LLVFASTPLIVAIGLWKYRIDYRERGRTTTLGVLAILAVFLMPNLMVSVFVPWIGLPHNAIQVVGAVSIAFGLGICLQPVVRFKSAKKVVGMSNGGLVVSGLYRFTRNPQYLGYGIFLLGWVLSGNSVKGMIGVAVYWVVVHLTILIEEEHLAKIHGEAYLKYKKTTPRYLFF